MLPVDAAALDADAAALDADSLDAEVLEADAESADADTADADAEALADVLADADVEPDDAAELDDPPLEHAASPITITAAHSAKASFFMCPSSPRKYISANLFQLFR